MNDSSTYAAAAEIRDALNGIHEELNGLKAIVGTFPNFEAARDLVEQLATISTALAPLVQTAALPTIAEAVLCLQSDTGPSVFRELTAIRKALWAIARGTEGQAGAPSDNPPATFSRPSSIVQWSLGRDAPAQSGQYLVVVDTHGGDWSFATFGIYSAADGWNWFGPDGMLQFWAEVPPVPNVKHPAPEGAD